MKFSKEEIRQSMLLYAITDRTWLKEGETLTSVCEDVLKHGATFLQIREKDLEPSAFQKEALELKALCAKYQVPFVVMTVSRSHWPSTQTAFTWDKVTSRAKICARSLDKIKSWESLPPP